jgi:CoA:oxalate CoA-transferase
VLDLRSEDGKRLALELIAKADVLVENFRPGVMKRLGLDHETLVKTNPRLVYASISGFGQTGPMASAPAYAPVIHAASGYELAYNQYQRGSDRPANNGIFIADVMGASYAFGAINLALYEREKSDRGQHIDVSLMDSVLGMLIYEMQAAQFPPERPRQVYEPVRASDGYVMVAAVTQKNLETLFDTIGFPEGKTDPRFATMATKEANWPALLDVIERWTSQRPGAECEKVLMAAGVPCSRYRSVGEAMADPQCEERGLFVELGESDATFKVANLPYLMSGTPVSAQQLVAGLGQHTDEVMRDALGLDGAAIQALREKGTFGKARA